jgi:hypothetical protein
MIFYFQYPGMKILLLFLSISSLYYSCRPDREISSYVVRNRIVDRKPGDIDTLKIGSILNRYDRANRSYIEVDKIIYKGEKKILLSSDLFNDPVRLNFFAGFTRGFSIYDKYEKVNYFVMDSSQVSNLVAFYEKLGTPVKTSKLYNHIDYTLSKETFITFALSYYNGADTENKKTPTIEWMSIWINGREHSTIEHYEFIKAIKTIFK